ncbi:MAG: 16S rRNA (adenine(1518)-N(6)/adenine(1519)-N(6))-dimethyltransferase RsmA [Planctomycetota bacterium]|jgi:16S rRNA (adenine1518-N6/adenine1519-N6)-dimethyltransferase
MQTKHQIQQLLTSVGLSPNKRLGQHFLIDLNLMRLLVDSAHIKNTDIVLEVGCGTGSLTQALADKAGKVIAVERDKALAKIAETELAKAKNVQIIHADILETKHTISQTVTKAAQLCQRKLRGHVLLVANLPYNIASPLILNLLSGPLIIDGMYITVQKEVAQRITAEPRQKHYGILSISLAATGDVKTIRMLKPTVFWPKPQISSAMVSFIRRRKKAARIQSPEIFNKVLHLFLQHRRKMLKNCTKFFTGKLAEISDWHEIFDQCSLDPTQRPDHVSPENYIDIANLCNERLDKV